MKQAIYFNGAMGDTIILMRCLAGLEGEIDFYVPYRYSEILALFPHGERIRILDNRTFKTANKAEYSKIVDMSNFIIDEKEQKFVNADYFTVCQEKLGIPVSDNLFYIHLFSDDAEDVSSKLGTKDLEDNACPLNLLVGGGSSSPNRAFSRGRLKEFLECQTGYFSRVYLLHGVGDSVFDRSPQGKPVFTLLNSPTLLNYWTVLNDAGDYVVCSDSGWLHLVQAMQYTPPTICVSGACPASSIAARYGGRNLTVVEGPNNREFLDNKDCMDFMNTFTLPDPIFTPGERLACEECFYQLEMSPRVPEEYRNYLKEQGIMGTEEATPYGLDMENEFLLLHTPADANGSTVKMIMPTLSFDLPRTIREIISTVNLYQATKAAS